MFEKLLEDIVCPACEEGKLKYSNSITYNSYADPDFFDIENMDKLVEDTLNEYFVLYCQVCNYTERYTFKDIEKLVRSQIIRKVIAAYASKELQSKYMPEEEVVYIYCGDCNGFDGKGSCPISFYDNCGIRRLA